LAAIDLYGVTTYTVAQQTSEIGIRMALGAQRGGVVGMVMRKAMSQTAIAGLWRSARRATRCPCCRPSGKRLRRWRPDNGLTAR